MKKLFFILIMLAALTAAGQGYNQVYTQKINNRTGEFNLVPDTANFQLRDTAGAVYIKGNMIYQQPFWTAVNLASSAMVDITPGPSLRKIVGDIDIASYSFETADNGQLGQFILPADYNQGDTIILALHIALEDAPAAGDTLALLCYYSWKNMDSLFTTLDTVTLLQPVSSWTARKQYLVTLDTIPGPGQKIHSSLVFTFFRLQSSTHDTYDDWMFLISASLFYRKDSPGSMQQLTK
jgi:hypothetical protein